MSNLQTADYHLRKSLIYQAHLASRYLSRTISAEREDYTQSRFRIAAAPKECADGRSSIAKRQVRARLRRCG